MDYTPVIIQAIVSIATIFGGAGFWQFLTAKQSRENGLEKKVDGLMCGTYDAAFGIYGD